MRRLRAWLLLAAAGWPAVGFPADSGAAAASLALGEPERQEAIRVGRRSIAAEDFGREWRVRDEAGQSVLVMTPFHRVALEARKAAFRRQPVKPRDVDGVLRETTGKLAFWVTLRGPRADFARYFTPVLRQARTEVAASFVQNERTALREEDGRFAARCLYVFPTAGLDGQGRLQLVVRNVEDKEVATFTVDLSGMR
jgi:hypothetical protein